MPNAVVGYTPYYAIYISLSLSLSLSLTHTHTPTHALSLTNSPTYSLSLPHILSLSPTHTPTISLFSDIVNKTSTATAVPPSFCHHGYFVFTTNVGFHATLLIFLLLGSLRTLKFSPGSMFKTEPMALIQNG